MKDIIRIFKLSPKIAISKVFTKIAEKFKHSKQYSKDRANCTYYDRPAWLSSLPYHFYALPENDLLEHYREMLLTSAALSCSHNFDLLGTGITKVSYNLKPEGMEGYRYDNTNTSKNIFELIKSFSNLENRKRAEEFARQLPIDYQPIDWQIDFQCGYRWSDNDWSKHICYGDKLGADIKIPWELGRLQHFVPLSLAYSISLKEKNISKAEHYKQEFCNQLIDFYVSNPPRFGTQWMSTMDVSIRVVNILAAHSFFKQAGANFDKDFYNLFYALLFDHYEHIKNNPEWSSGMRGNHYLAGISGLLILASHLPANEETDGTIVFAIQELIKESFYQFHHDGGNFEGSLAYNRFSFEMLLFGLLTFFSLPPIRLASLPKFTNKNLSISNRGEITLNNRFFEHLFKIFEFQIFSTTKSQYLPQFGDNDSGYFIRFSPNYLKHVPKKVIEKDYFFYNANSSWNVLALFAGFFSEVANNRMFGRYLEFSVGQAMRSRSQIDFSISNVYSDIQEIDRYLNEVHDSDIFRAKASPDFGLFSVWRNKYNFVIHCGKIGQNGKGGHDHNDQLSFELMVDQVPFIVNAGTYCYTPLPNERNRFRSVHYHNTLVFPGAEQNKWLSRKKDDLFWLEGNSTKSIMRDFSDKGLIAEHSAYGPKHIRRVVFENREIRFSDECQRVGFRRVLIHFVPGVEFEFENGNCICRYSHLKLIISKDSGEFAIEDYYYSSHYGLRQNAKRLAICGSEVIINWNIKI